MKLGRRVGWLTAGFALALFSVTLVLTLVASYNQAQWMRLLSIETEAVATLQELVRLQNGFRQQVAPDDRRAVEKYRAVEQLLDRPALRQIEINRLRERVAAYRWRLEAMPLRLKRVPRATAFLEVQASSNRVTAEAQRVIESRRDAIAAQVPKLQWTTSTMMTTGMAVAWIVFILYAAAAKRLWSSVVKPIRELLVAAEKIRQGDLNAKVPVSGDEEIYTLARDLGLMAEELKARARTDELTGLPNFRSFRERIDHEIDRSNRSSQEFGVLVLDLDHFKKYNDQFGHLSGNDALQRVASAIRQAIRTVDFPARYGGEEFAVIAPKTDGVALRIVAERIRHAVEALPAPAGGTTLTISGGAALYPADGATAEALFQAADERLYQAKKDGRNRIVIVTPPRVVQSAG